MRVWRRWGLLQRCVFFCLGFGWSFNRCALDRWIIRILGRERRLSSHSRRLSRIAVSCFMSRSSWTFTSTFMHLSSLHPFYASSLVNFCVFLLVSFVPRFSASFFVLLLTSSSIFLVPMRFVQFVPSAVSYPCSEWERRAWTSMCMHFDVL